VVAALVALAALSLWWLQHPPRTSAAYRHEAVKTLESLRSHVGTTRLWARELAEGDATRAAAAIAFEEASRGAQTTASTFDATVPPRGEAEIRSTVGAVAAETSDSLGRLHIAARRDEWEAVPLARDDLDGLFRRLDETIAGLSP